PIEHLRQHGLKQPLDLPLALARLKCRVPEGTFFGYLFVPIWSNFDYTRRKLLNHVLKSMIGNKNRQEII
ncbi:MAG TPA: hypothetical protein PLL95_18300, partial [Anaerolineales bacterium]|nr:hypothetical protein [Anaerolineales bacterium]